MKLGGSPEIMKAVSIKKSSRFFRRVIKEYTWDNIYKRKLLPLLREKKENRIK